MYDCTLSSALAPHLVPRGELVPGALWAPEVAVLLRRRWARAWPGSLLTLWVSCQTGGPRGHPLLIPTHQMLCASLEHSFQDIFQLMKENNRL